MLVEQRAHQRVGRLTVGQVHDVRRGAAAVGLDLGHDAFELLTAARGQQHHRAAMPSAGGGLADPGRGTGDQHRPTGERAGRVTPETAYGAGQAGPRVHSSRLMRGR